MDETPSFGAWLKRRRRALDLTQEALAQLVGCSVVSIRKFESDEQRPSRPMAVRLAEQLQIPRDQQAGFVQYARVGLTSAPPELPLPLAAELPERPTSAGTATSRPIDHAPASHQSGNLPIQLASFVGRVREQAEVLALLRRADVRLLTLTGSGGIGKTSLALRVAAALIDDYPDGVWFVDLSPVSDPELVPTTIAQELGIPERMAVSPLTQIQEWLRPKQLLLVLDNYEQVLDAASVVSTVLGVAPGIRALVTSRAVLQLRGEHEYPVAPLGLPPADRGAEFDLSQSDAMTLFVERAQAVLPQFALTRVNAGAVAAICARLDGLPLAIELAVARLRLFPPDQLRDRLLADGALALLALKGRDLPDRQQTMRATIAWSYGLLSPTDQALFARLSVFVGGWTIESAEAVCSEDAIDVVTGLTILVEQSLVRSLVAGGSARLTMFETLRDFALERLVESGLYERLRARHAHAMLAMVETIEPQLHTGERDRWLDRLELELDNLRATLTWSLATPDDAGIGLRVVLGLVEFWHLRDHLGEAFGWIERLLSKPSAVPSALYGRALLYGAMLAENLTHLNQAVAWGEQSLALHRALGDQSRIAETLIRLGRCKIWQAAYPDAEPLLREGLDLLKTLDGGELLYWALQSLGDYAHNSDRQDDARRWFQQALELCADYPFGRAWSLTNLGRVAHAQGDQIQAERYLQEAHDIFRLAGSDMETAHIALDRGRVAWAQGQRARARSEYRTSLSIFSTLRTQRVPECLEGIAMLDADTAHAARAAQLLGAATALRESIGVPLPLVQRPAVEQAIAHASAQLGTQAYQAAWEAGRRLTRNQMTALALSER